MKLYMVFLKEEFKPFTGLAGTNCFAKDEEDALRQFNEKTLQVFNYTMDQVVITEI